MSTSTRIRRKYSIVLAAAAAAAGLVGVSRAATLTWNGGSPSTDGWSDASNWNNTSVNNLDILTFGGTTRLTPNNDTFGSYTFSGITFNAGAGAFVLGGNSILLGAPLDAGGGNQLGGGIINNDGAGVAQTVDMSLTLAAGRHNFSTNTGSGALVFGTVGTPINIVRNQGSLVAFTQNGGNINFTYANGFANDASGIMGGWATIGNDWAALDGSQNVVAYTGYTDLAAGGQAIANNANSNVRLTGVTTGNSTAATGTVINTILDSHTDATARTVTITGTMRLGGAGPNSGGIFRTGAAASTFTLTGGTVTASGGGELTFSDAPFNATANNLTIASVIANDGGAVSVNTMGYVVLSATNTYTGGTTITQGRVQASATASFGGAAGIVTVLPGGQAFLNNNGTYANPFVISGIGPTETSGSQQLGAIRFNTGGTTISGQLTVASNARVASGSGATNNISGKITGPGRLEVTAATGNNVALLLSNSLNDWTGGLLLTNGAPASADRQVTVRLNNNTVIPDGGGVGDVTLNSITGKVIFDINGRSEVINGIVAPVNANDVVTNSGAAATLTVGAHDGDWTFGGAMQSGLSITKSGNGTFTVTSASTSNTHTGTTTVNQGTLLLNPSSGLNNLASSTIVTSGSGVLNVASIGGAGFTLGSQTLINNNQVNGAVTAPAGSTVKGTGTFNNLLTLTGSSPSVGGILSPGNSIGSINLGNGLTVSSGGQLSIEMDGTLADLASVTGTANVAGLGVNVSILNNNPPPVGSYTVLSATTLTGVPVINTPTIGRQTFSINGPALATNIIQIDVSGAPATVRWDNSLGGGDGINWEASTAANRKNWVNTGTGLADWFFQADSVVFNDTNNGKYAVTVPGTVNAGSISITNNGGAYTFSGAGSIVGGAVLTKSGTSPLTISTSGNTYAGGTVINAGTLNIGSPSTATAPTLGTGALTLGAGVTIDNVVGVSTTLANNIAQTWNGNLTFVGTSSLNMGTGAITLTAPANITVTKNTLTVGGAIADAAGSNTITKLGTGTLTLTGNSSFQGPVNINAGVVTVGNSGALGSQPGGNVTVAGGTTLNLGGVAANNALNFGAKVFHIQGTGFNGMGAITNRDLITAPSGTLGATGQQNAFQQIVLDGATTIGGPGNGPDGAALARIDIRAGAAHGATLNLNGFDLTHQGNSKFTSVNADINGTGNMICLGINDGASNTGGSFAFEAGTQILDDGGTSKIIMRDTTLLGFFNNGATGLTSVTRRVEMGDGLPGSFTYIANGGAASSVGSDILLKGNLIVRSTYDNFQNQPLTLAGNITQDATSRKIQKVNFNLLELAGTASTFTGGLEIAPGAGPVVSIGNNPSTATVRIDSQGALPASNVVTFNLPSTSSAYIGVLQLNNADVTVAGLTANLALGTAAAFVENNSGTAALTVNNSANYTFGGVLRDGGGVLGLTKDGTASLTLTSANTYSGTTTITNGTLNVGNGGTTGTLGTGPVVVNSTNTLAFNHSDSITFSGAISGTGTVAQNGSGTLTLNGTNTHSNTNINNGTLVVATPGSMSGAITLVGASSVLSGDGTMATVNMGTGSIHPGPVAADNNIGTTTIGSLNVTGGDLRLDITSADTSPGANNGTHDVLSVTNASFTGTAATLSPFFTAGVPSAGDYTLIVSTNAMTHTTNPVVNGGGGSRLTFTPQFLSGNTILNLNITGSGVDKTWTGTINNSWNVASTNNWSLGGTPPDNQFFNLDSATFDDTAGAGAHNVTMTQTVTPTRMVVNTSSSYDINTNGFAITGPSTSLYVQAGKLVLRNTGAGTNTFGGPINLDTGTTLELQAGGTIGTGPIGATSASLAVNRSGALTVGNTITGAVNLTVDAGGNVTLNGTNAITTGDMTVANGALRAGTVSALPAVSANVTLGSGANSGLLDLGGGTISGVTNLNTSGTGAANIIVNNSATTASTINFIGSGTPSTFNGSINTGTGGRGVNLSMTGGNLTIAGGTLNTSSGSTTVLSGGILTIGASSNLFTGALTLGERGAGSGPPAAGTVGTINLNNNSTVSTLTVPSNTASINSVTIASGKTLTITGQTLIGTPSTANADGTLATNVTMGGGGNLTIDTTGKALGSGDVFIGIGQNNFGGGDTNVARVDLTGLTNFTYTSGATGTGRFGVGWMARPDAQLRLPAGTNTIITNNLTIGSSQGTPGFTPGGNLNGGSNNTTLFLGGGTNIINAAQINVGAVKGLGHIDWQVPGSGSVVIAGQAGGTSRADITVGSSSSATGSANPSNILLAGHVATVQGGTVVIGREAGGTTSGLNHIITFDTGTFDVNNLQLGLNTTGASPNGADGIFQLGTSSTSTGTLTVNTQFALGLDSNTAAAPTKARFNALGGTANINANIIATANDSDSNNVFAVTIDGATVNMTNHNIGDATRPVTLNAFSGTLKNVAQINAGAGLTKGGTAGATFSLDGVNTFTGPTAVTNGTLQYVTSHTTGSSLNVSDGNRAYIKPSLATPNNVVVRTGSVVTNAAGHVDIGDNKMIVTTTGATGTWNGANYTGITGQIAAGRGSGVWDGAVGIVTSMSDATSGSNYTSVGVAVASDVRPATATATGLWGGQTITGTDTLVMYTYGGDANLDGKLNIDDYVKIDQGISAGLQGWSNGDFNYDGKVNIDDYSSIIDSNIGIQGAAFPAAGGLTGGGEGGMSGVSAVPEPASMSVMVLSTAIGLMSRRRRRRD